METNEFTETNELSDTNIKTSESLTQHSSQFTSISSSNIKDIPQISTNIGKSTDFTFDSSSNINYSSEIPTSYSSENPLESTIYDTKVDSTTNSTNEISTGLSDIETQLLSDSEENKQSVKSSEIITNIMTNTESYSDISKESRDFSSEIFTKSSISSTGSYNSQLSDTNIKTSEEKLMKNKVSFHRI